jgi:hypothetical protein
MRIFDKPAEGEFCKVSSNQLVGENAGLSGVKRPCIAVDSSRAVGVLFVVAIKPIDEQPKSDRAVLSKLEYAVHALLEASVGMPTRPFKVLRITTY